ncbi:MAG TPA: hypothetical protein VK203_07410 [Nostocaceae cyanobacterium]|nr:hypothetical protein [Nostocaceae cyanobacterium]
MKKLRITVNNRDYNRLLKHQPINLSQEIQQLALRNWCQIRNKNTNEYLYGYLTKTHKGQSYFQISYQPPQSQIVININLFIFTSPHEQGTPRNNKLTPMENTKRRKHHQTTSKKTSKPSLFSMG